MLGMPWDKMQVHRQNYKLISEGFCRFSSRLVSSYKLKNNKPSVEVVLILPSRLLLGGLCMQPIELQCKEFLLISI